MRRAERVYQELPQLDRKMLSDLLDGFEEALEEGLTEEISRFREAITEFLERFDFGSNDESE